MSPDSLSWGGPVKAPCGLDATLGPVIPHPTPTLTHWTPCILKHSDNFPSQGLCTCCFSCRGHPPCLFSATCCSSLQFLPNTYSLLEPFPDRQKPLPYHFPHCVTWAMSFLVPHLKAPYSQHCSCLLPFSLHPPACSHSNVNPQRWGSCPVYLQQCRARNRLKTFDEWKN